MGHSINLLNIKVHVTFTTRKPPHQISDSLIFFITIFFFLRGKGGAAAPWEPVSYAYDNCHNSMLH